jgi:hypothetical protein
MSDRPKITFAQMRASGVTETGFDAPVAVTEPLL